MSKLVDTNTGDEIKKGDHRTTFRGEVVEIMDWYPKQIPSTGRVVVSFLDDGQVMEYYPQVVDAEIILNEEEKHKFGWDI